MKWIGAFIMLVGGVGVFLGNSDGFLIIIWGNLVLIATVLEEIKDKL